MVGMTDSSHRLSKPMEYGLAADDTTYGIQSLADVNVALHEDRERSARAGDNTTFGVQLFADANVTLHDASAQRKHLAPTVRWPVAQPKLSSRPDAGTITQ